LGRGSAERQRGRSDGGQGSLDAGLQQLRKGQSAHGAWHRGGAGLSSQSLDALTRQRRTAMKAAQASTHAAAQGERPGGGPDARTTQGPAFASVVHSWLSEVWALVHDHLLLV